jgi:hypothetical protein
MLRNRLLGSAKSDPQCASDPSPVVPVYQLRPRHFEQTPFPAFRALRRQDGPPIARRPTYHVWSWAVAWLAPSRANRTHRPLEWQRMVYWIHFPKEASCLQTVPLPDCMEWRTTAAYSALQFKLYHYRFLGAQLRAQRDLPVDNAGLSAMNNRFRPNRPDGDCLPAPCRARGTGRQIKRSPASRCPW